MTIEEIVQLLAADLYRQIEGYLAPLVQSGCDPEDWVLETSDISTDMSSQGIITATQHIRLRPKLPAEYHVSQVNWNDAGVTLSCKCGWRLPYHFIAMDCEVKYLQDLFNQHLDEEGVRR